MRFVVPSGAKLDSSDIDYHQNVVCLEHDCLEHGFGGLWSSGTVMRAQFFTGLRQMTEREMYDVPNRLVWGREYRGVRDDGTYFRWVGVINETISYDHAAQQSARMFDSIIDSLCWLR